MIRQYIFIFTILICFNIKSFTQDNTQLQIETFMQGKDFVGYWPHDVHWSDNSKTIYFKWNLENAPSDSTYKINLSDKVKLKTKAKEREEFTYDYDFSNDRNLKIYSYNGDLFLKNVKAGTIKQITKTIDIEEGSNFSHDDTKIIYTKNSNLFSWNIKSGVTIQITNFKAGFDPDEEDEITGQKEWLKNDQLENFKILKKRHDISEISKANNLDNESSMLSAHYTEDWEVIYLLLSPDEKYIYYQLYKDPENIANTKVPAFVTEDGYTKILSARPKVGSPLSEYKWMLLDIENDTCYPISVKKLPGINETDTSKNERKVYIHDPIWNEKGNNAVLEVRSLDNKDRWITLLDLSNGKLQNLDRQNDTAWIAGPGISYIYEGGIIGWMEDDKSIWFQSEETGFSHLYSLNTETKSKKTLTEGTFEIYDPILLKDKQYFYFTSNQTNPGIREFYKFNINSQHIEQLTNYKGRVDAFLSPFQSSSASS